LLSLRQAEKVINLQFFLLFLLVFQHLMIISVFLRIIASLVVRTYLAWSIISFS
jgi:hypothetical protein